jgi:two-component system, chemotaxis family, protein-glutamate methylesterase/glutaminase
MSNRDIVALGTSAGGVEALMYLARHFRPDFPASVLVTIHLSSQFRSSLDELLSGAGPLPASFASDGAPLRKGRIYIAPPDRHLLVEKDQIRLGTGPRENNARPAIDPMLRSTALCCCGRSIGVVLTGTLGDGASGLWTVSQCGGTTVVQDPRGAAFPEMPQNALNRLQPDHVVALDQMPALLESLAQQPAAKPQPLPANIRREVEIARSGGGKMSDMDRIGRRSVLTCPDCHGVMWEIEEGDLTRFRCHVGHTYTAELMSLALDESLRRALASAQRALEERVALADKLYRQAEDAGRRHLADTWSAKARECEEEMKVIRGAKLRMEAIAAREELGRQTAEAPRAETNRTH